MTQRHDVMTVHEAAEYLGLTPMRIRQFCQEGRFGEKFGPTWMIERQELKAFKKIDRPRGRPPREK